MVTGGHAGSSYLDTSDVYQDNEWRTVSGKLPRAIYDMEAAVINDKIILFGICHL